MLSRGTMSFRLRHLFSAAFSVWIFLVIQAAPADAQQTASPEHMNLVVQAKSSTTPFPHFWERSFGSGRAILSLRQSYRDDLRTVKEATEFDSVRFHGIFMDDVGLYDPDRQTINFAQTANQTSTSTAVGPYNFSYVDQIYDGLLANGVRPFVELSFMPKQLAARDIRQSFWYRPVVSPPKDYGR